MALVSRTLYPTLAQCRYLNQASLGLVSRPAVAAMRQFLDEVAQHGNLHMTDEQEVAYAEALRCQVAALMNADADRIALTGGASELLGQLPGLLRPCTGSTIVAVATDFPAVTRPWLRYAAEHDCAVHFVKDDPAVDLTDALIQAVGTETGAVTVSFVQYGTGTRIDVPRLRQRTAALGVPLIVDATQAAGLLRVDSKEWGADAVVASGYKWLGGHGGCAVAALDPKLLSVPPPSPGWMGAPDPFAMDAQQLLLAPDARRYTQSTMSYISMAGLTAALDLVLGLDADECERHSRMLATGLIAGAQAHGWEPHRPLGDVAAAPHIVALSHPNLVASEVVKQLQYDHGIVCSSRAGTVRVSLAPYNDETDVVALLDALGTM